MFWSRNCTFYSSMILLSEKKQNMVALLKLKGRGTFAIQRYIQAFDYFCQHPNQFDGATIVKDLDDLPNLDLDAMVHDFDYLTGANKSFRLKWNADMYYIRNMEKNGKGIRVFRLLLLTILGVFFVPFCKLFK